MGRLKKLKDKNMLIKRIGQALTEYIEKHDKGGKEAKYHEWYVGITEKNDDDNDGKVDRFLGHKTTFPHLHDDTWWEYTIDDANIKEREEIVKEVEKIMGDWGFDVGGKIQGSLKVKTLYTFKKGPEDLRDKN